MTIADMYSKDVLLLNWRDLGHPQAGGAEVYTWEIAKRFAKAGARVTLVTARHPQSLSLEVRDGVRIIRRGGRLSVYAAAAAHMLRHRGRYEVIVDFQNGIPFFSPLFARRDTAVVCVFHHVHQHQFALHFSPAMARLGRALEKNVARLVYGKRPLVAVSTSTRRDVRLVLGMKGPIHIVPNGVSPLEPATVKRSVGPTIAVVTRLVPQKRLNLLIEAVAQLRNAGRDVHLDIAGVGPDSRRLLGLIEAHNLQHLVRMHGYVDEIRKAELLRQAWLTAVPSIAEGWGLTVIEANSVGVPAIAFDVPGLRDSIRQGVTGWLLPEGSDLAMGLERALGTLEHPESRHMFDVACKRWASQFEWDSSAARLGRIVISEFLHRRAPQSQRRVPSDLGSTVEGHLENGSEAMSGLAGSVRRTDSVAYDGDTVRLMLDSCDEEQAAQVAARLGIRPQRLDLATSAELAIRFTSVDS
jgi:glycosyltransferase involved in cell wall biosynthesis